MKRERERERESKLDGGELDLREFKNLSAVDIKGVYLKTRLTKLDLSDCVKLEIIDCSKNSLTTISLFGCNNLKRLNYTDNNITSVDFLTQLPNPEKLERLRIYDNNIQPTDISIFSRFTNLEILKIGTTENGLRKNKHNRFYGSLKSYQNLTKLESICIEETDVNEGLEYLPESLVKAIKSNEENYGVGKYSSIECSPHSSNAKCKAIQDQLRPYDYDLEAWQLANPEKMLKVWKEKYSDKEQLVKDLETKITETKTELETTKQNESEKTKKISRLKTKLNLLQETHDKLKAELEKEQQQHNQTKTNFQSQLRDLATILFPNNSDINNINFGDLKDQVQKTLQIQTQNEQKITNLQTQLANTQEALAEEEIYRDRNFESAKQKDVIIKEMAEELNQANQKIFQLEQNAQSKQISDETYLEKIKELEEENKDLEDEVKSLQKSLDLTTQKTLIARKSLRSHKEDHLKWKNTLQSDLEKSKTTITQLETKLEQQAQLTETKLKAINASLDPKSNPDAPIDFDGLKEKISNILANHQQCFQDYQEELENKDQKIEELEQIIKTKPTVKDSATQTDQLQETKDTGTQTDDIVETKKEEDKEDCIKFLKALEQRCREWYPILLANINAEGEHAKELDRVYNRDLYLLIKGFRISIERKRYLI